MTAQRVLFPQFRDEQSDSKYPFVDGATLTATNTGLKIAPDMFIDALFFGIGAKRRMYISAITITTQTVTIAFGDVGNTIKLKASYSTPPDNGVLQVTDNYSRPAGILLAGRLVTPTTQSKLVDLASWPIGTHTFNVAATEFVTTAVVPAQEPGVRGLLTEKNELLAGDVWIIGDGGVVVRHVPETSNIRIDVIGVPLFKRYVCVPQTTFPPKCYLRTINGCPPDAYGNFTITSDQGVARNVVRVYPGTNGVLRFDTAGPSNV